MSARLPDRLSWALLHRDPTAMPNQRPATQADLDTMWALRTRAVRASCASHYPAAVIDTWCASPAPDSLLGLVNAGGALVAQEDSCMLGYAILDLDSGEVDAVFVDPGWQGSGIALRLLTALEAMAIERGIERLFLSASLNAVPFYQRAGFSALREEIYPHRSGVELRSVFMEKRLPCGPHGPEQGGSED
ncbi:GNAT family N-acetyltransferase [Massilia sp. H6]|uniref:GNAT family N-acetyltransferase n=1 Tax=Massilia sp. H6 TaxID=2970464 RepID=UPI0021699AA6|nr:GNAT family N-acetyltransferase [Massilia sp. H6]UVW28756.1 GNAT family N-acetyltransferase [Massilia sp. H6]